MDFSEIDFKDESFLNILDFTRFLEKERKEGFYFNNIHIVATISSFNSKDEFYGSLLDSDFLFEGTYGNLSIISKDSENEKVKFFVFFDDSTNVPIFITNAKKSKELPELLFKYINHNKRISNLWISPKTMKEIKDDFSNKYEGMLITYFSARRSPNTDIKAEFRPEISRGIIYRGIDGKKTLEEMEYYYGVLPKILEIKLPNSVEFRIDNKGIITLRQGRFEDIFHLLNHIIEKVIIIKEAIRESEYRFLNIGKNKQFRHAIQKPWSVKISDGIDSGELERICNALNSEEWNFTLLESVLISGSLLFTARLIDSFSGTRFDISTTGKTIEVFPIDEIDIGSSMRFYEFILENIDDSASVG